MDHAKRALYFHWAAETPFVNHKACSSDGCASRRWNDYCRFRTRRHLGIRMIQINISKVATPLRLLVVLAIGATASAQYGITDLGTLGGPTAVAHGINVAGQVVGEADTPASVRHAFLWQNGSIQDLNTPAQPSAAYAISNLNQIVGTMGSSGVPQGPAAGFTWSTASGASSLAGLPGEGPYAVGFAINATGQIAGEGTSPPTAFDGRAAFWSSGSSTPQDIGGAGPSSLGYGINSSGQVVGWTNNWGGSIAFSWTSTDGLRDLGTLPGDNASRAQGINDSGQVVGASWVDGTNDLHAVLWTNTGGIQNLGALGGSASVADAINASAQVVGLAQTTSGATHAFLWQNGTMTDLNALIGDQTWVLTEATAINNSGQIVGYGLHNGQTRAFLLSPNVTTTSSQTVFLVHGIAQNGGESGDLKDLAASLRDPTYGLDASRFTVDAGFDYGYCAATPNCSADCTIQNGARSLALYINQESPGGNIILIGYSMGGLIARDMILNNYLDVTTNHHVEALITLATPNLGYPYEPPDGDPALSLLGARCNTLAGQMFGDFRNPAAEAPLLPMVATPALDFTDATGNKVALSSYLYDLNTRWATTSFQNPDYWYAIAGSFCSNSLRFSTSSGCPDNTRNDGVVCSESAGINIANGPIRYFDLQYSHSASFSTFILFCPTQASLPLFDPPNNGSVIGAIRSFINGIPLAPPSEPAKILVTNTAARDSLGNVLVNVTLTNEGASTADAVVIRAAKIGATPAVAIPTTTSGLTADHSLTIQLVFPASVGILGTSTTLSIGGTYSDGSFNFTSRIVLP